MNGISFMPPGSGMPGAVPNFPPSPISGHGGLPPGLPSQGLPPGLPPGAIPHSSAPPMGAQLPPGAIPGLPPAFQPPGSGPLPEYGVETQLDGSILLRSKNPDGSPGVVLQVLKAPKSQGTAQPPKQ